MIRTIEATLHVGHSELDVEIEYTYAKGAKASWDDPGWPPEAELQGVIVTEWNGRHMAPEWMRDKLDQFAFEEVVRDWDEYRALCLEQEAEPYFEED